MKKLLTIKAVLYAIAAILIFYGIGLSFYLMNQPYDTAFWGGVLLLVICVFIPIDFIIKQTKKPKQ